MEDLTLKGMQNLWGNKIKQLGLGQLTMFIISPYDIDKKNLIDIDNKMIDLMYNDLINTNNILDINERINYIHNKSYKEFDIYTNYNLVKKLIENENYIVLHDILINSKENKIK